MEKIRLMEKGMECLTERRMEIGFLDYGILRTFGKAHGNFGNGTPHGGVMERRMEGFVERRME